jgi:methylenetetrahydrofolate reductase (NADPH)
MRLDVLMQRQPRTLSFEFFPPKNDRAWYTLEDTIAALAPLGPDFISVTYGAGGSTREKTREVVEHIQDKTGVTAMAHITCVNATKAELRALFDEYASAGIENLLALRGDPPKGQARFVPTDGGCAHASDLVAMIRQDGRFSTLCAAFPERHPDAPSRESDWGFLRTKLTSGACAAITQGFFDARMYTDLIEHLTRSLGKRPRVIPGIFPVTGLAALEKFSTFCNATIPDHVRSELAPTAHDPVANRKAAIAFTVRFCKELLDRGAPGLHIYALNRGTAAAEVVSVLRHIGAMD